jgi:hypothetical protein
MMNQAANDQLSVLKAEHRELDARIAELSSESSALGSLEIARLKKRKLLLKDQIQLIIDRSVPDIIA